MRRDGPAPHGADVERPARSAERGCGACLADEVDRPAHAIFVVAWDVAGEFEVGRAREGPHEDRGLARWHRNAATVFHFPHGGDVLAVLPPFRHAAPPLPLPRLPAQT